MIVQGRSGCSDTALPRRQGTQLLTCSTSQQFPTKPQPALFRFNVVFLSPSLHHALPSVAHGASKPRPAKTAFVPASLFSRTTCASR